MFCQNSHLSKYHLLTTLKELNYQLTEEDSSAAFLLPFLGTSRKSSPAVIASMEAAMPALSFLEKTSSERASIMNIQINSAGF